MAQEKMVSEITAMETDFAQWYTDVVKKADLVDYSGVPGFMIYRPYGYAIWENIQHILDTRFKETGHENVYMPMLIPEALLNKEKEHVEGFAPEVAWATIMQISSVPGATCPSCITSGALSFVGKRPRAPSCAPANSCGRRVTPCTRPPRRHRRRPSAC